MQGRWCTDEGHDDTDRQFAGIDDDTGQEVRQEQERGERRRWLRDNYPSSDGVWLVYPNSASGEKRIPYNDAVEEALCFGWIDSTLHSIDPLHSAQRFTPRRQGSGYSRANIERLAFLDREGLLMPEVAESVRGIIDAPFVFPEDTVSRMQEDGVWEMFDAQPGGYRRIRVGYVDAARGRPVEFEKRLSNLIETTREGRIVRGFGGIDKYYGF